jgi:hypothetical protein
LDSNTRGWVPFTQHTDSPNKHEHSNSFDKQEHSHRKLKEKEKTRRKDSQVLLKKIVVEETGWMDNKRGKVGPGIGIYFMLSKLAST